MFKYTLEMKHNGTTMEAELSDSGVFKVTSQPSSYTAEQWLSCINRMRNLVDWMKTNEIVKYEIKKVNVP